jgi:hypothetical protein
LLTARRPGAALCLITAALALSACGGGDKRDVHPEALLDTALGKPVASADTRVQVEVELEGVPQLSGPVTLSANGPYASGEGARIPSVDWQVEANVAGFGVDGELVSTGEDVFISVFGDNYKVGRAAVAEWNRSAADIAIHPRRWFGKATYEGDEEVEGVDAAHITARLRGDQVAEDLGAIALALGLGEGPRIRGGRIEAWIGFDDEAVHELRVVTDFKVPPDQRDVFRGATSGSGGFDVTLSEVGEEQEITIPEGGGFKPIGDLLDSINELGSGLFALA